MSKREKQVKRSFAISPQLDKDLSYVAKRMNLSKSALISAITEDLMHGLAAALEEIPEGGITKNDYVRFYGKSKDIVIERLETLRKLNSDIFSKF